MLRSSRQQHRIYWSGTVAALTLACWIAQPTTARADRLDEEMMRQVPKVMKYLRDQGYRNVGVLDFRFNREGRKPSFHAGPINDNVASRLQNALILSNNPEKPIGIINEAGKIAGVKLRKANYRTPDNRAKLFDIKYPLAWGKAPILVAPDAFLTGRVGLSKDLKKTFVAIEVFDRKSPGKLTKILEYEVKTDRFILADSGYSFGVTRKFKFRRGLDDWDDIIISDASDWTTKPNTTSATAPVADWIDFKVFYGDSEQVANPDPLDEMKSILGDGYGPDDGQEVTFRVKNTSGEKLGVVLVINNKSTLYEEEYITDSAPEGMSRWILEPGKEYVIKGYYQLDNVSYKKIVGSESVSIEDLGGDELAGRIQLFVFKGAPEVTDTTLAFSRNLRPLSSTTLKKTGKPSTVADLQRMIARNGLRRAGRAWMVPGDIAANDALKEDKLESPTRVASWTITYKYQ